VSLREADSVYTSASGSDWSTWAALFKDLFVQQERAYARQLTLGAAAGRAAYRAVRSPVTPGVVVAHLCGRSTAAWYQLDDEDQVRWGAYDCDATDAAVGRSVLETLYRSLVEVGCRPVVELSRRGGHVWLFVEPPGVPAWLMVRLLASVLRRARDAGEIDSHLPVETYPKQVMRGPDGLGSALRGPLGVHAQTGMRYPFLDVERWEPVASTLRGQLDMLQRYRDTRLSAADVANVVARVNSGSLLGPNTTVGGGQYELTHVSTDMLSDGVSLPDPEGGGADLPRLSPATLAIVRLVRNACDLRTEVSHWTQLDARGRGSCPIHPPDLHPSFAVIGAHPSARWVCFHQTNPRTGHYLGGDLIALVARLRGVSYGRAAWELARARRLISAERAARPWRGGQGGSSPGTVGATRGVRPSRRWWFTDADM
jgi:GNAT superfamily N-acetyltransferase